MNTSNSTVERGSGNVFADLDLPDADAHLLKAELVSRIDSIVRQRRITQTEAARLLGLSQPDVSRLLRGDFRQYSLERLFRLLMALGRDIDIMGQREYMRRQAAMKFDAETAARLGAVLEDLTEQEAFDGVLAALLECDTPSELLERATEVRRRTNGR